MGKKARQPSVQLTTVDSHLSPPVRVRQSGRKQEFRRFNIEKMVSIWITLRLQWTAFDTAPSSRLKRHFRPGRKWNALRNTSAQKGDRSNSLTWSRREAYPNEQMSAWAAPRLQRLIGHREPARRTRVLLMNTSNQWNAMRLRPSGQIVFVNGI